jgi:outer membrane autotransporter protein
MKLHLPVCLLSAVLTCYVSASSGCADPIIYESNTGAVKTEVYGEGEQVTINGGRFESDVYGGGDGDTIESGTQVIITGGTFKSCVYGGGDGDTIEGGTYVTISGGSFESMVYGGGLWDSTIEDGTHVTISGGSFDTDVYGGGNGGTIKGGTQLTISGGSFDTDVYGGGIDDTIEGGTHVTISGGKFSKSSVISAGMYYGIGTIRGGTSITIKNGALNEYTGALDGGTVSDGLRSLVISGGSNDLSGATITNFDKIKVTELGSLTLKDFNQVSDVTYLVEVGSTLVFEDGRTITSLSEDSSLTVSTDELSFGKGEVNLDSVGDISQKLNITEGSVTLSSSQVTFKGISVQNGGVLTVGAVTSDSSSALRAARAVYSSTLLCLGDDGLTVDSTSTLTLTLSASSVEELVNGAPVVTSEGNITLADESTLVLNNASSIVSAGAEEITVTLMTSTNGVAKVGSVNLTDNVLKALYDTEVIVSDDNKSVFLVGTQVKDNSLSSVSSLPVNARVGAELLWNDRFDTLASGSPLADVFRAAVDQQAAGDSAALSKTLAAVAGSTINSAGTAQRDALRDQLGTIRDRALAVSTDGSQLGHHFWIEGNGGYNHVRTQSDKGGYKLSTWGATVGADLEATKDLTLGLAFTANYGDLRATAADRTTGDLDSYYLNLFAHYQKNAWGHTLVLTGTTTDADLDRTVDYGAGAYKTKGSTDGYGIGALYELTYDVTLNDKGTSLLQPLFDASIVHTSLDGYTETGAGDAGLKVGKQDWTTASLAVGARWSGTFGTKTVGRTLFGELRTAVSQDFGDKQGKTAVALSGAPDFSQNVYGAKQGATAWQVSGGLSLPVSQRGTLYANAGVELRDDANSVHGNIGYRYSF